MDSKKVKASLLAVTAAVTVAVSGTFAWQNLNQATVNETIEPDNPGGRLHDDFSGWENGGTKDVYVENFSNQIIYARVRLDEYMELGEGAGLRSGEEGFDTKAATPLVAGADIDDETTWTTHIPDATLTADVTPQTPADADADPFHTYWTWTMGGQDAANPDGKTVYMPTFNKNKDSLYADVNGTMDGTGSGASYDDYVQYATDSANGIATKTAAEYADADADATDECGPEGGPGGTGVVDVNYIETPGVTHTAAETLPAKIMTMAEWKALSDTDPADGSEWKGTVRAWVYDADGWAYWSQPIQPNTATGLLLDKIVRAKDPGSPWYYSINAVAEFITDDSLGYADSTGFYTDAARTPSTDALALLGFIGVDTTAVGTP